MENEIKKAIDERDQQILEWCWKNNTIPMQDLHNLECVCGHSVLEHEGCDLDKITGNNCGHIHCTCLKYRKVDIKPGLRLATTDGGWVNCLELQKFLKNSKGGTNETKT